MFDQEAEHDQSAFIDRFFAKKPNPGISWLHSIGKERYEEAAQALLEEAKRARELQAKHLMLSIGKLSQLAGESADEKVLDGEFLVMPLYMANMKRFHSLPRRTRLR